MITENLINGLIADYAELKKKIAIFDFSYDDPSNVIVDKCRRFVPKTIINPEKYVLMDSFFGKALHDIINGLDIRMEDIPSKKLVDTFGNLLDKVNNADVLYALNNLCTDFEVKLSKYQIKHGVDVDKSRLETEFFRGIWDLFVKFVTKVKNNESTIIKMDPANKYQPLGIIDRGILKTSLDSKNLILLLKHIGIASTLIPSKLFKSKIRKDDGSKFYTNADSIRRKIDLLKNKNNGKLPSPDNHILFYEESLKKYFKDHNE